MEDLTTGSDSRPTVTIVQGLRGVTRIGEAVISSKSVIDERDGNGSSGSIQGSLMAILSYILQPRCCKSPAESCTQSEPLILTNVFSAWGVSPMLT